MQDSNLDPLALQALLNEEAWLRRLATALAGPEGGQDLAQDVVLTALREGPGLQGPRLRAWLRTVAKRLAIRSDARDRSRRNAEEEAALPEVVDRRAADRLLLHRRLTEALSELEAPYRTALVLRFLEQLTPGELAQRLGLSPDASRKRTWRALRMLRARLDRDFGDRETWMASIGMLLAPTVPQAVPPFQSVPIGVGPALPVALLSMKKVLITLSLVAAFWFTYQGLKGEPDLESGAGVVPAIPGETETVGNPGGIAEGSEPNSLDAKGSRQAIAKQDPAGNAAGMRLRITDEQGEAVPNPRAAWLDSNNRLQALNFDSQAVAAVPERAQGRRVLSSATGFAMRSAIVAKMDPESSSSEQVVVLTAPVSLKGRLLVDGKEPGMPVRLKRRSFQIHMGFTDAHKRNPALQGGLRAMRFLEEDQEVETRKGWKL